MSCSKPCLDYSVFSFHIVGRHCLVEILGYLFFWRCSIFCSMIVFRHGVMLGPDKKFEEGDVASLAAMSLLLIPWWDGTQAMIMSLLLLARHVKIC